MESETELSYKSIFEMISLPILVADSNKNLIFSNRQGLKITELSPNKLYSTQFDQIFSLEPKELKKLEAARLNQQTYHSTCLFHHAKGDCSELSILVKGIRLPLQAKPGYYIEVQQSKKVSLSGDDLAALGGKTSSIAHDISNPLAVLKIHCDNFSLQAQKDNFFSSDQILERVKKLVHATDRITISNSDLKDLSKTLIDQDLNTLKSMIKNTTNH